MTPMDAQESSKSVLHNWRATALLLVFSAAFGGLLVFGLAASSDETRLGASCGTDSRNCPASGSSEPVASEAVASESVAPTSCSEVHMSSRGGSHVEPWLAAAAERARLLNTLADGS